MSRMRLFLASLSDRLHYVMDSSRLRFRFYIFMILSTVSMTWLNPTKRYK